ncbi:unnamed protein product [Dimorphilus gyrociliatus]|uniref:G-protein coupled receptors family 1 profile domain-containing protein n=1 Tax=Dimorphilus gyrociliatus TaxID=2664684 RepID=A0A7I8W3K2_9ANNE|nr:unnamed protein product [Dimorphilus gyrociliatus]
MTGTNVIDHIAIPLISCCGVLGNFLNVVVFTSRIVFSEEARRSKKWPNHSSYIRISIERSLLICLTSWAMSNFLICIMAIPKASEDANRFWFEEKNFTFYYALYSTAMLNMLSRLSVLLATLIVLCHYCCICWSDLAAIIVHPRYLSAATLTLFFICVLGHVPDFLTQQSHRWNNTNGTKWSTIVPKESGASKQESKQLAYKLAWSTIGFFIPLVILCFCFVLITKQLRTCSISKSTRTKKATRRALIAAIVLALMIAILATPSEVLDLVDLLICDHEYSLAFRFSLSLANLANTVQFSFNSLFCLIIDVNHRRSSIQLLRTCQRKSLGKESETEKMRNKPTEL